MSVQNQKSFAGTSTTLLEFVIKLLVLWLIVNMLLLGKRKV